MPLTPFLDTAPRARSKPAPSLVRAVAVMAAIVGCAPVLCAEEPAQRFLEQLRAQGYEEMALRYLDRIDEYPGVPAELREAADLERAQILLEAGQRSRVLDQRDQYFGRATEALQRFVADQPSHPRRAEAQLRLGNLQLLRGAQLIEAGGAPTAERRARAKDAFLAAANTFNTIVTDLRSTLEQMQGQRIDAANEPDKVALRDRYRAEYLQALLLGGEATKRAAEAIEEASAERKQLLEQSLERFNDLRDKYDDTLAGVLATLYAAQAEQTLGNTERALANFLAVLEQDDSDVLRNPKMRALVGLIRLYGSQSPPNWQEAVNRAQPWIDGIRPDERQLPEVQELRIALADAYLGLAEQTENAGDKRKHTAAARETLLPVSRTPGPFQQSAAERLARLGVDAEPSAALTASEELPKTFAEAMEMAKLILEEENSLALTAEMLQSQRAEGAASETANEDQMRASLTALRDRGIHVLRHALRIAGSETGGTGATTAPANANSGEQAGPTQEDLNQARASLAFLLYRNERFREAAAVGEFVARHYPSSEQAVNSGLTALGAWQSVLRASDSENNTAVMNQLRRVAETMVSRWPNDARVRSARELLVRIAISSNDFAAANEYLGNLDDEDPAKAELQRAMGRLMWNQAITLADQGDAEGAAAMRAQAEQTLLGGLEDLAADQVDGSALEAAMLLARVRMLQDNAEGALAALDSERYGPLRRMDDVTNTREGFRGDVHALALQALVSQLSRDGADSEAIMERAAAMMQGLQQAYVGAADGEQKLVATYFRLARDIRQQLESAPPDQQQRLTTAFTLFLDQLAQNTDDAKTLHWAAQTLLGMGQSQIPSGQSRAQGAAEKLIRSAIALLEKIDQRATADPKWMSGESMLTQVRLELGTGARLVGEYGTALAALTNVLSENRMLVDAQIEAALVYEQWAASLQPQHATISYGRAISGAKPDAKGQPIIWGWGTIARKTMSNPNFEKVFFDARYHLALCRYLQGNVESDPEMSKRRHAQAVEDIRTLYVLYPELGGPAGVKRFDALLREIQKALGTPREGLAQFASATSP